MRARLVAVLGILAMATTVVVGMSLPASAQIGQCQITPQNQAQYSDLGGTATVDDVTVTGGQRVRVFGTGFACFSSGRILFFSAPADLGGFTADGRGNVSVEVTIPLGVTAGNHNIVLEGVDPAGNPRTVTAAVVVPAEAPRGGTGTTTPGRTGTGGSGLARTGAQIAGLTGAGALLIGTGLVLFRQRRRRAVA